MKLKDLFESNGSKTILVTTVGYRMNCVFYLMGFTPGGDVVGYDHAGRGFVHDAKWVEQNDWELYVEPRTIGYWTIVCNAGVCGMYSTKESAIEDMSRFSGEWVCYVSGIENKGPEGQGKTPCR